MSRRIDFFRWLIYYSFMIKIKDMEFEYYDRDEEGNLTEMISAIRGIRFEAEKGAFIALCGRNGSGKSTFAKLLNALEKPSSGSVLVNGLPTSDSASVAQIRESVSLSLISFLTMENWLFVWGITFSGIVSGRIGSVSKLHFFRRSSISSGSASVTRCPTAQVTV